LASWAFRKAVAVDISSTSSCAAAGSAPPPSSSRNIRRRRFKNADDMRTIIRGCDLDPASKLTAADAYEVA
jgi:hypothetical protein